MMLKYLRYGAFAYAFLAANAYADYYKVYSPEVNEGEVSAEANINYSGDNNKSLDHYFSQVYGVDYGVTSFWETEVSAEIEKSYAMSTRVTAIKWENVIAPFKPGENWVDAGLYVEFEQGIKDDMPDNLETRLLLEKRIGHFINTANISLSHSFGPNAVPGLDTGIQWRTKYHINEMLEPGIEYYSNIGKLNRPDDFNRQDNVLGPVLQGHFGEITYDSGILFGVSQSAHDVTFKLNLEYEF